MLCNYGLRACALALLLVTPPAFASGTGGDKPAAKSANAGEAGIVGEWWTEKKEGRIRFSKYRDGTYTGVLTWSKHPRPDTENDNPKLRKRSIIGIILMWKLHYEDGEYEDGYVYNPEDGNVYRIDAKVIDRDKLKIHGYLGLSIFGQSQIWTRYR
jgi:uncharacterized protein (DUF2147 family)